MTTYPFLRYDYKSALRRDWLLFDDNQGCTPVQGGLCLDMDKSPPPLPQATAAKGPITAAPPAAPPPPAPSPPTPPPPPPKPDTATAFLEWMIARGEKKKAKENAQAQGKPAAQLPKPFDLYDIPSAMKAAGFAVSAKLSQRWLDGRAYTAYGSNDKEGRFDSDMIDLTTVSLNWLRDHAKIEARYQALLGKLDTEPAQKVLQTIFSNYLANQSPGSHDLNTREKHQGDWQSVHAKFQFQLEPVSTLDTLTDTLGMTDITTAMANFAFYAAVARAKITGTRYNRYNTPKGTQQCSQSTVQITHVWIYAKDSYSFHDEGASSQYLGHWNKNGVIVLPMAVAASVGMKEVAVATRGVYTFEFQTSIIKWFNAQRIELWNDEVLRLPMDIGRTWSEKDVYYPVRNIDYRNWRNQHQRGGDFLIMTEPKLIKLEKPITLNMPEVCK